MIILFYLPKQTTDFWAEMKWLVKINLTSHAILTAYFLFFLFVSLPLTLKVTLSYGWFENKMNSVELKGVFTKDEDPSRLVTHTPSHIHLHAEPGDIDLLFMTKRLRILALTPLSFVHSTQITRQSNVKVRY